MVRKLTQALETKLLSVLIYCLALAPRAQDVYGALLGASGTDGSFALPFRMTLTAGEEQFYAQRRDCKTLCARHQPFR